MSHIWDWHLSYLRGDRNDINTTLHAVRECIDGFVYESDKETYVSQRLEKRNVPNPQSQRDRRIAFSGSAEYDSYQRLEFES